MSIVVLPSEGAGCFLQEQNARTVHNKTMIKTVRFTLFLILVLSLLNYILSQQNIRTGLNSKHISTPYVTIMILQKAADK